MSIFITYFVDLVFLYHWYARVSKFFDNSQLKLFHNYWSSMVHRTCLLYTSNVHPSKLEVRFSKESQLRELIYQGVSDALAKVNLTYDATAEYKKTKAPLNLRCV